MASTSRRLCARWVASGSAANDLAAAFDDLGDHAQAQQLYALGIRMALQDRDARNLAQELDNLGDSLQESGQLAAAERVYQLALEAGHAAGEQTRIDDGYRDLVGVYATMGAWAKGEAAYSALQDSPDDDTKRFSIHRRSLCRTAALGTRRRSDTAAGRGSPPCPPTEVPSGRA